LVYFTVHVVNNPLESQFDVACVDTTPIHCFDWQCNECKWRHRDKFL